MTRPTFADEDPGALFAPRTRSVDGLAAVLMCLRVVATRDALDTALAREADPASQPELAIRERNWYAPGIVGRWRAHFEAWSLKPADHRPRSGQPPWSSAVTKSVRRPTSCWHSPGVLTTRGSPMPPESRSRSA
jgi:hypothetical protein